MDDNEEYYDYIAGKILRSHTPEELSICYELSGMSFKDYKTRFASQLARVNTKPGRKNRTPESYAAQRKYNWDAMDDDIREMIVNGTPIKNIAQHLGVTEGALRTHIYAVQGTFV